jgi:hypothetical protein
LQKTGVCAAISSGTDRSRSTDENAGDGKTGTDLTIVATLAK